MSFCMKMQTEMTSDRLLGAQHQLREPHKGEQRGPHGALADADHEERPSLQDLEDL